MKRFNLMWIETMICHCSRMNKPVNQTNRFKMVPSYEQMLIVTNASFLTQSCSIGGKRCPLDKSLSSGEHNWFPKYLFTG